VQCEGPRASSRRGSRKKGRKILEVDERGKARDFEDNEELGARSKEGSEVASDGSRKDEEVSKAEEERRKGG